MNYIAPYFKLTFGAAANPEAVVEAGQARFTVLAAPLFRMEYSSNSAFEDRASQAFWYREQPLPEFTVHQADGVLVIETSALRLHYCQGQPFSAESLWIDLKEMGATWRYGDPDPGNLGGTARTLDGVDGAIPISLGLVSRSGWSLVDDSASLVFSGEGWLEPRDASEGQLDLYFFGYGHNYLETLRDFTRISGAVSMIPRWVLGNWWSRYWEYTQEELTGLIEDFQNHEVPLSVCIIDMDWHITNTGNNCSGWTGYSWNRQLFPDPEGLLRFLHEKGLKVALNLHPAEGVHPHEAMYAEMCEAVGQDPAQGEPVAFDITEPRFVDAYFRVLHHPMEASGIDFWWMDWQQGQKSRLTGLDPLWWLNHLHFYDLARNGSHRSFIFSRWGGLGNHRYPIGFSGDTVVTWASLAFQPYFTATASNVNYGWWSHDVGGHMRGIEDAELNARWVQLGVFLPVLRIHSTKNPYQDRRPWAYDAETFEVIRDALQLRHALIPYIYSMAWRFHRENVPPLLPMYYNYPEHEAAYACPNQYLFGDQLVVAPFIMPKDADTLLSRATVWLPEGEWFDYFTGQYYHGDSWQAVYGTLRETPVFAKAGAIVPQAPKVGWDGIGTPKELTLHVFPGADGRFELYDDEGNTNDYLTGVYALTPMVQEWSGSQTKLSVGPVVGEQSLAPALRTYNFKFRGFTQPEQAEVRVNGQLRELASDYDAGTYTLSMNGLEMAPGDCVEVTLSCENGDLVNREDARLRTCLKLLKNFHLDSGIKASLAPRLSEVIMDPQQLGRFAPSLKESQLRAFLEVITEAGMDETTSTGKSLVVVWNNRGTDDITLYTALDRSYRARRIKERFPWTSEALPKFQAFRPASDFDYHNRWIIQTNYYNFYSIKVENREALPVKR